MAKKHKFSVTLRMDNDIIGSRQLVVEDYPENIIYSLKLNEVMYMLNDSMRDMLENIESNLRDNHIDAIFSTSENRNSKYRRNR